MKDAQVTMMTNPTLDALDNITRLALSADEWQARAVAAEAYLERIRAALGGYQDSDLASLAETLKARCNALEAAEADLLAVRDALAGMIDERDEAQADVARLRAALSAWVSVGDEIMMCATGRPGPLSDSDVCGEIERLRAALTSLFDAHYGTAYHHCGDGDGIMPDEAAEIVALVRSINQDAA